MADETKPVISTAEALDMMQRCKQEITMLRAQISHLQPKAEAYENIASILRLLPRADTMSIVDAAKIEMELSGITGEDQSVMLDIMRKFFDQWDSGGAVAAMLPVLNRLIAGKPLGPLTGADSEWMDTGGEHNGHPVYQNIRCGSVFKQAGPDGEFKTYDIDAGPDGRPVPVVFPYTPERAEVRYPIVGVGR